MMRFLRALVIAGMLGLAAQSAWACDPVWLPIARPHGIAFLVATASGATAGGQRAELQLAGGSAASLRRGPVILVPWEYGPDCRPIPWNPDRTWQLPRTEAFYNGQLRPRDQWLGGVPTLDVHMAWREPLWQREDARWTRPGAREALLTPAEFFTVYESLPTEDTLTRDRGAILAQLSAWAAKHPSLAQREPARTILANIRRALGGVE